MELSILLGELYPRPVPFPVVLLHDAAAMSFRSVSVVTKALRLRCGQL